MLVMLDHMQATYPGLPFVLSGFSFGTFVQAQLYHRLIALEAAASGVPVVAAASGGLRESVVDGVTGVVLDSRDPARWGETLTRLLGDDATWQRLATAARVRALQHPWSLSAAELADVYCRLTGSDDCTELVAAGGRR